LTVGNTDHEAGVFLGKSRNSHVSVSSLETILVKFSFGQVSAADKSISTVLNVIDTNSSNQVNAWRVTFSGGLHGKYEVDTIGINDQFLNFGDICGIKHRAASGSVCEGIVNRDWNIILGIKSCGGVEDR